MRARRLACPAAVILLAVSPMPVVTAQGPPPLVPTAVKWLDSRLEQLTFADPIVNPPLPQTNVRVLLPVAYASSTTSYPTLYLLHGAGDTSASWTTNNDGQPLTLEQFTAAQEALTGRGVVVVMPDGGQNQNAGWYSDWYNGGNFGPPQWETYHLQQLITYIETHYRVRSGRAARAIAGLSMGGFGGMSYAARHPDMFSAAFSFSGFVNSAGLPYLEPIALATLHSQFGTPTDQVWGKFQDDEIRWRGHNPSDLADNLAPVRVWFTTGEGVPGGPAPDDNNNGDLVVESAVYSTNQTFDLALTQAGVAHTFDPYPMGGHNWWHWQDDLHRAWPLMLAALASPPRTPATFAYRSIEPSFSVWGWDLNVSRGVSEFLSMTQVSRSGLTLVGSGRAHIDTPPDYIPGGAYRLTLGPPAVDPLAFPQCGVYTGPRLTPDSISAAVSPTAAIADPSGRLHFDVTLGASHALQQCTPEERTAATVPGYWEAAQVRISSPSPGNTASSPPPPSPGPQTGPTAPPSSLPNTAASHLDARPILPWLLALVALLLLRRPVRRPLRRLQSAS